MSTDCIEGCVPPNVKNGEYNCCGDGKRDKSCPGSKYRCFYKRKGCDNLAVDTNLAQQFMNGGLGYGSLCIPEHLFDISISLIFPPLYVILSQLKNKKIDFGKIILNFVLTSLFYFPGLVHALYIMKEKPFCGSTF
jgi:uncharacterized membrane protein YqaE (UPF0057 family)